MKIEAEIYYDLEKFLGRYVVVFQRLERNLDTIIELAFRFQFFRRLKNLISRMSNREKIAVVRSIVVEAFEEH